jgi:hypothetical protein
MVRDFILPKAGEAAQDPFVASETVFEIHRIGYALDLSDDAVLADAA